MRRALGVGCGEGVIADRLHRRWGEVVALDLPDAGLRADWRGYRGPRFLHASANELPFGGDLGSTPGHLNHWSKRGFVRFVSQVAEVREVSSPFPWTIVWATLPAR